MNGNTMPDNAFYRILWDFDHPDFVRLCGRLHPEKFIKQVVSAGFDCVGLFAKDSLGQSLYPTQHGFRHPGLSMDMLGSLTQAAKAAGLTVIAYYNGTQDTYQATQWLIRRLLPRQILETDAAEIVEVALARQNHRVICHFINYANEKGYSTRQLPDYIPPIFNIKTTLNLGVFRKATCYPGGTALPLASQGERVSFSLPRLDIHNWVVLD